MTHYPSSHMVAVAWFKTLPDIPASKVATTLPADVSGWAGTGFVQIGVVGGSPGSHAPGRHPVVQVDCWGAAVGSDKAPWGRTEALASAVVAACYRPGLVGYVAMPDGFHRARVLSVVPLTEPRRITEDEAGFARVQLDVALHWATTEVS